MSKRVKVLFLGASYAQIPILIEAKNRGYYVITCDYLPDNPGHRLADECHNISTTSGKNILALAEMVMPDLIVAYASDPAVPAAAYISEKLGLPGNSVDSVRILTEKDRFRRFQKEKGYNTPEFALVTEYDNAVEKFSSFRYPFIVKPTDSSGSKGVSRVCCPEEITAAVDFAFQYSRSKRILGEEFINNTVADLHGDGFVVDGELVFSFLGDHIYNQKSNPFNPIGTIWPSSHSAETINRIDKDVASIIKGCGFKNGPINIEARINSEGRHFVMEIGPRNGGHFVPQAIQYATGFDMVKACLDVMLGEKIVIPHQPRKFAAYYAIHSDHEGELENLSLCDTLLPYVKEFHQYIFPGMTFKSFRDASAAIGILILAFEDRETMNTTLTHMDSLINITIKGKEMDQNIRMEISAVQNKLV